MIDDVLQLPLTLCRWDRDKSYLYLDEQYVPKYTENIEIISHVTGKKVMFVLGGNLSRFTYYSSSYRPKGSKYNLTLKIGPKENIVEEWNRRKLNVEPNK